MQNVSRPLLDANALLTRRELLRRSGMGFAALGLAGLVAHDQLTSAARGASGYTNPMLPRRPQFPAKAKHVIHLFMNGGPSHVNTFDTKPALEKFAGKTLP